LNAFFDAIEEGLSLKTAKLLASTYAPLGCAAGLLVVGPAFAIRVPNWRGEAESICVVIPSNLRCSTY
jgi:hypothetical protein